MKLDSKAENAIDVKQGTFSWERSAAVPILNDINLSVKPGELVAVVGKFFHLISYLCLLILNWLRLLVNFFSDFLLYVLIRA